MPVKLSCDSQRVKIIENEGRSFLIQCTIKSGQNKSGSMEDWKTGS